MLPVYGRDVRPGEVRRNGVLVCRTFLCIPDTEIQASTCHSADARGSVGTVSTSPVGDGRLPSLLDTAGMVLPSPVVDGCPPRRPSVPLSGHPAERSRRPATRSQYPVPGGCVQQLLPDTRVWSGLPMRVSSGLLLVLPRLVH